MPTNFVNISFLRFWSSVFGKFCSVFKKIEFLGKFNYIKIKILKVSKSRNFVNLSFSKISQFYAKLVLSFRKIFVKEKAWLHQNPGNHIKFHWRQQTLPPTTKMADNILIERITLMQHGLRPGKWLGNISRNKKYFLK